MRILIMGLPGSGKTTLAKALSEKIDAIWFNADLVRTQYNDWDFSHEGRVRQAKRMRSLATLSDFSDKNTKDFVIVDFVCPLPEMREIFDADITIWVDTIIEGIYENTNKVFVPPNKYDYRVTEKDAEKWAEVIAQDLLKR